MRLFSNHDNIVILKRGNDKSGYNYDKLISGLASGLWS